MSPILIAFATTLLASPCGNCAGHPPLAVSYCSPLGIGIDCLNLDGLTHVARPPIPEVVLLPACACRAEAASWRLTSNAIPKSSVAVSLTQLIVEVHFNGPVQFVELTLDGTPVLQPELQEKNLQKYELSCPDIGKHFLQARYLKNGVWSGYSPALHFEVRLPAVPKILAISDGEQQPVVLARNEIASITSDDLLIRLADIGHDDAVVAYIDGKPLRTCFENETCCRKIRVKGQIAPGVHTLTVRVAQGCDSCSITSPSSNAVSFHYYDESIYLLRPGGDCENSDCRPNENNKASKSIGAEHEKNRLSSGGRLNHSQFHFVAFNATDMAKVAGQLVTESKQLRDLLVETEARIAEIAELVARDSEQIAIAATSAKQERDAALTARRTAEQEVHSAVKSVEELRVLKLPDLDAALVASANARDEAQVAFKDAVEASDIAFGLAARLHDRSMHIRARVIDATRIREVCKENRHIADQSLARARIAASNADIQQNINGKPLEAERARNDAEVERNRIKSALDTVEKLLVEIQAIRTESRTASETSLKERDYATEKRLTTEDASKTVASKASTARTFHTKALEHPQFVTANQHRKSVADANGNAERAAIEAIRLAQNACDSSKSAFSAAEQARTNSEDESRLTREALDELRAAEGPLADAIEAASAALHAVTIEARKENSAHAELAFSACESAVSRVQGSIRQIASVYVELDSLMRQPFESIRAADRALHHAIASAESAASACHSASKAVAEWRKLRTALEESELMVERLLKKGAKQVDEIPSAVDVDRLTEAATEYRKEAEQHAESAKNSEDQAKRAAKVASQIAAMRDRAQKANENAIATAESARHQAELAGISKLEGELDHAWNTAELSAIHDSLRHRIDAATKSKGNVDAQRAEEKARIAELQAEREESIADAAIREDDANDRIARASKIKIKKGPQSPFFFAAAAHFPLRDFGAKGEVVDRPGLVIYEDMEFRFDREGNYEVHFRATSPEMPTTLRLQFQIQPRPGAAWYTISLAPIEFKYPLPKNDQHSCENGDCDKTDGADKCCGETRNCVCKGRSEILRRCYAEMGDSAKIRRQGTARMGFGVNVP